MKKIFTRTVCMAMCAAFAFSVAACGRQTESDVIDANYQWLDASLTDTSQLDAYSGQNRINLTAWNVSERASGKKSSDDVVSKEIERVTGVAITEVLDNKDSSADARYNQLSNTGLPDIAYGRGWIDPDALWDLTDLIDEYCPTIKARMPASVWNATQITGGQPGKVYGIPYGLGNTGLSEIDPLADPQKTVMFEYNHESYPYIYVRDDVLTAAYPNAKTQAEIDALYETQGYFTEEDLFDVEITSATQFRTEFLPRIQEVLDTAKNPDGTYRYKMKGGREVKAMLVTRGTGADADNWDFLGVTIPKLLGAAGTHYNTGFTYWDKQTQKIELMLTQDFYKNEVYEWAKMIADGTIVSDERMDANPSTIQSEYNSGYYAIGYLSNSYPLGLQCKYTSENGVTETVKYRKVYMKIPLNDHFEFFGSGVPIPHSVMFFKDSVRESDLPQLLRWLDYQCSRLGDKLYSWGPSSAGLFNEDANGVRTYKDEQLADQMVYSAGTMGTLVQKYNLSNGSLPSAQPVFSFAVYGASIYHPKTSYDLSKVQGMANSFFSSATVCKDMKPIGIAKKPSLHEWTDSDLDGIERIWGKRANIETDLTDILLAGSSKSAFDAAYAKLTTTLNQMGWTKAYFNGAYTNKFLELNQDYLHLFYQ